MATLDRYTITETLHEGSTFVVYRGIRQWDDLPVIIKALRAESPAPREVERLRREYQIGRQLDSSYVIKLYDLETHGSRLILIAEDFGGEPLSRLLGAPLEMGRFLDIAIRLSAALADIHSQGVVHKDIKPANILIHPDSSAVKLTNFGSASQLAHVPTATASSNSIEGSPAYMSPEQTGRMNQAIDHRSDLYSLGVTFYEMLTGVLPFQAADPPEWMHSQIAREPRSPCQIVPSIPEPIAGMVMKLLAKQAEYRYQSARGLQLDLQRCREQWESCGQIAVFPLGEYDSGADGKGRESEERYRKFVEISPDSIGFHRDGKILYINPAGARLLGATDPAEIIGRPTLDFAHPDSRPLLVEQLRQLHAGKAVAIIEARLVRLDGDIRDVEVITAPISYQGQPAFRVIWRDITERKRAEEQLQRRADEFATLYDTTHDLATQQDVSTLLETITERAMALLGVSGAGVLLYDPARGDLELVFVKGFPVPLGTRIALGEGMTGRVAQSRQPMIVNNYQAWEHRVPRFEGLGISALMHVPMLSGGDLIGVLGVNASNTTRKFTDVDARLLSLFATQAASVVRNARLLEETHLRAAQLAVSEEQTRLIVDSAYDAFIVIAANGLITDWNRQAEVTFGWSREEVMGRLLSATIIPAQHQEAHKRGLEHFLATGEGPLLNRRIEVTALHRDGHEFPVELTITPIRWGDSYIFSAFVHDISERKQAEALRAGQSRILEMIATSAPLEDVLTSLMRLIESQAEGMLCSVLFLDEDGLRIRPGAAPSLPEAYIRALDGVPIGPRAGSCGTAMYSGKPVIVTDILHDPLWDDYPDLVAMLPGLRACWSTPIFSSQGRVLGSFAMYYREVRSPSPAETRLIDLATHIAGIAIQRKRAEEALRKAEEKYRSIFENAVEGIFQSTPAGKIIAANPVLAQMLGYESSTELMATISDIRAQLYVELERRSEFVQQLEERGVAQGFTVRVYRKDGSPIWVSVNARAVRDHNGQALYYEGTAEDITERKRVERHQTMQYAVTRVLAESATLAEAAPQLLKVICESLGWEMGELWSVDRGANLIRYVEAWHVPALDRTEFIDASRRTAYAPGIGLPGRIWQSGQPAWIPDVMTDTNFSRSALAAKAGLHGAFGFPILLGSQTLGVVLFLSCEIRQPDDDLLRLLSTVGSQIGQFAERKQAEEELRKHREHLEDLVAERTAELAIAKDKAEEADRLKSAFLATMSHELRTPLNSIIGFTGIMLQGLVGPLNDEQQKQLNMVKSSARHLLNLINEVLDLSKIEAGQVELHLEAFDMHPLIDKTVQTLAPLAAKKQLQLIADMASEVSQVISDPYRVEQILINLVNNAIKFTEQGEVRIGCRIRDGWLLTSVTDTGIGIKPEDLAKLFTTFRQLDSTLARKHEGAGLGLAICKKLADLLGAEIWVESAWGRGSAFTLALPLNRQGGGDAAADSGHRG